MRRADGLWASNGTIFLVAAVISAALCGSYLFWNAPDWMVNLVARPLEQRFQHAGIVAPETLIGIIIPTGSGSRFFQSGQLARHYPHLKIVISGAHGADDMPIVLARLGGGIDRSRVLLEIRSTNTYENALYSNELIRPKPGDRWLLATSAWHMPRSIGSFRKIGFEVEPWPANDRMSRNYRLNAALREWLALIAYNLLGRTSKLLPAP